MYLLRELLLAETIEKIIRMDAFLDDVLSQASEDDLNIIKLYQSANKSIRNQLIDTAKIFKQYHEKDINKQILEGCLDKCINSFNRVAVLHNILGYLPNLQAKEETYLLIKSLLKEIPSLEPKLEPSIVLSDIYNYEVINISKRFKEWGIPMLDEDRVILELPKIEKENPLMWTILIHEIGHNLDDKYLKITKETFKNIHFPANDLKILKKWIKEIVADLISLRIIGPAYMMSFMFFNLLSGNLESFSNTHPSPKYRLLLMESKLKDEFDMEDIKGILELLDERQVLYSRSDEPDEVMPNLDF